MTLLPPRTLPPLPESIPLAAEERRWLVWVNFVRSWLAAPSEDGSAAFTDDVRHARRFYLGEAHDEAYCFGHLLGGSPAALVVPSPDLVVAMRAVDGYPVAGYVLREHRSGYWPEVRLECRLQEDGSRKWLVSELGGDLNNEGEFEHPPINSSKERYDFLARCRFASAGEVLAIWDRIRDARDREAGRLR